MKKYYFLTFLLFLAGVITNLFARPGDIPAILGKYTGEVNAVVALLSIDETIDGISIELKQSATNYSLIVPKTDLGNGVILPEYELDNVLVTASGAGYTLTKSGSLNIIIPEIEIPPVPPLFPDGETFYDVPVEITLENGYVENNILTLEIKAVATLTVYGIPMSVPVNLYFEGTKAMPDVVEIYTPAELKELADFVNAGNGNLTSGVTYILMNDILLNGYLWTPIGTNANGDANKRFKGDFNGNNKKIKNLKISNSSLNVIGLFGYIDGTIENLGIENADIFVNISNECEAGILAGHIAFSTNNKISNCYTTGTMNITANSSSIAGGLIGFSEGYEVSNCYSTATVNCNSNNESIAGGLIGATEYTTTSNCYATGKITSSSIANNRAGGLVGTNQGSSIIRNCVAANSTIIATSYLTANRIIGYNVDEDVLFNNYAIEGMTIIINDVPITVIPDLFGKEGANATMATLCSAGFYNTPANWDTSEGEIWNIELPGGLWKICERERLPFFSWQGVTNCLIDEAFCGGDGSPDNPFQICTPKDLDYVRKGLHLNFILMNDLDLTDYIEETYWENGWIPIGYPNWPEEGTPFEGTFDGNNHKITGLWLVREEYPAGLFSTTKNATIKNLGIDCEVEGGEFVGGLTGKNGINSVIENCYVTGGVLGMEHTGGLIGYNDFGASIKNCYALGAIIGKYSMGMGNNTGGLVGSNFSSIQNCHATGTVTGSYNLGGLVGYNEEGDIINCMAANSSVTANDNEAYANRITGYSSNGTLSNNYALESMTVTAGGEPITVTPALNGEAGADATLTTLQSFTFYNTPDYWNTEEGEVWDIKNPDGVWKICDGEEMFPFLRWQGILCEGEGIEETGRAPSVLIYPNPTNGELRIESVDIRVESVDIFDIYGRNVGSIFPSKNLEGWQPKADGVVLDISNFPAGIYFLKIHTENGIVTKKVVKE